ncbi:pth, partial [Symbiodinium pilosum]
LHAALKSLSQLAAPFLAVVDDCWLPLGSMRFRENGSSGGHKGLEGIESTFPCGQAYHRLRIGIGGKNSKEFVTGDFTEDEEALLKPVLTAAVRAVQ